MCILADGFGFTSGQTINGNVLQRQHGGEACYNPRPLLVAPYMVSGLQDPGFLKEIGRIFAISSPTAPKLTQRYQRGILSNLAKKHQNGYRRPLAFRRREAKRL